MTGRLAIVATAIIALGASNARAWNGPEHAELSAGAYQDACREVAKNVSSTGVRFTLACGSYNVKRLARLFGQAVEIAGDHLRSPGDFFTAVGDINAINIANYGYLALVNTDHFHPHAPRNWLRYHQDAIVGLMGSATSTGTNAVDLFDREFYVEAFAEHFLEDSFAAGHMGFNRSSSSATASKGFHDIWNANGRYVRDQLGVCWRTFGDGYFQTIRAKDPAVWRHVEDAARASMFDFLMVFVTGRREPKRELDAWDRIPVEASPDPLPSLSQLEIEMKTTLVLSAGQSCANTIATAGVSNAAHIRDAIDFWASGEYEPSSSRSRSGIAALWSHSTDSLAVHRLELGLGAGAEYSLSGSERTSFAPDVRTAAFLGPTVFGYHGLLRSEVGLTGVVFWVVERGLEPDLRAEYRLTIEAADWVVRINGGPSWDIRAGTFGAVLEIAVNRWFRWIDGGGLAE
jgi:hypothetical protein